MDNIERYAENECIINSYLKKSTYYDSLRTKLESEVDTNKASGITDFTSKQYTWLDSVKVDISKLHFSSSQQKSIARKIRLKSLANRMLVYVLIGGFWTFLIGGIGFSLIHPLTLSAFEKCKAELSNNTSDYCKDDGTRSNPIADKLAIDKAECSARGAQWGWSTRCYREQYNSKQDCIDAGEQKSVKGGEYGPGGYYECGDDGKTHFKSEDEMIKAALQEACVIKGNVSFSTGERIYHVPGQAYYDQTTVNESYGERWFCSEEAAQTAGWRKAYE